MALKPMKTLTIGEKQYEIVDAMARANIGEIRDKIENTDSIQNILNEHNINVDAHEDIRSLIDELDGEAKNINTKINTLSDDVIVFSNQIASHKDNTENPHSVTKTQIGLSNVDNTSDINKPISIAQQEAFDNLDAAYKLADDNLSGQIDDVQDNLTIHINDKNNPHNTTAAQVGADPSGTAQAVVDVHNISASTHNDIRILINELTTRLNTLADSDDVTLDQMSEVVEYIKANKDLIDVVTTAKVNVSDIENNLTTNVADRPLSAAQGVTIKTLIDTIDSEYKDADENLAGSILSHSTNKSNPHDVTKSQVGLGNVDNTADINKPVSTLQQAAINSVRNTIQANLDAHKDNTENPHSVTKAQIGLGDVDNTSDINKPISILQATAIADAKKAGTDAQESLLSHTTNVSNPHGVTKAQVGLGNVDNTSDANKPVSTAQATAIADAKKAGTDAQSNLDSHISNKSNPHGVTTSQIGALPTSAISGTANQIPKFTASNKIGDSNVADDGSTVTIGSKLVVQGNGSSYNEGIRILPASNGWSNIFLSGDTTLSGNHDGGWLIGRRGQVGSKKGEVGDFTIENNNSDGSGLTLHKNGNASLYGSTFNMGNSKVSMQYDSANECLNFIFT